MRCFNDLYSTLAKVSKNKLRIKLNLQPHLVYFKINFIKRTITKN